MTDKQIIIDGKIKPITVEDVPKILELHKSKSFIEIAKIYGVTQNAIRYWVKKYNVKPLKQKDQIKILEEALKAKNQECEELKKTLTEIKEMLKEICMEEYSFDWNKTSKKHCGDCDCRYGQILQKISECEGNNDMENN